MLLSPVKFKLIAHASTEQPQESKQIQDNGKLLAKAAADVAPSGEPLA